MRCSFSRRGTSAPSPLLRFHQELGPPKIERQVRPNGQHTKNETTTGEPPSAG